MDAGIPYICYMEGFTSSPLFYIMLLALIWVVFDRHSIKEELKHLKREEELKNRRDKYDEDE